MLETLDRHVRVSRSGPRHPANSFPTQLRAIRKSYRRARRTCPGRSRGRPCRCRNTHRVHTPYRRDNRGRRGIRRYTCRRRSCHRRCSRFPGSRRRAHKTHRRDPPSSSRVRSGTYHWSVRRHHHRHHRPTAASLRQPAQCSPTRPAQRSEFGSSARFLARSLSCHHVDFAHRSIHTAGRIGGKALTEGGLGSRRHGAGVSA